MATILSLGSSAVGGDAVPQGDAAIIRHYLCQLVENARSGRERSILFHVGAIRDALALNYSDANTDICQVLETYKFQTEARVEFLSRTKRPYCGEDTIFRFSIL